jgi:hypothetical protein
MTNGQWMRPGPEDHTAPANPAAPASRIRDRTFAGPQTTDHGTDLSPIAAPRRVRTPVRIAAAALVAALAAAVIAVAVERSGSDTPPTTAAATGAGTTISAAGPDQDPVAALLQRRSHALLAGDEAGWLADIDPNANGLIAREKVRFANLRQLGLTSYRLVSYSVLAATTGHASVGEVMRLRADLERSQTVSDWTFASDSGRLLLTAVGPSTYQYAASTAVPNPPWNDVALRSATADGITILAPAAGRWNPASYLPAASKAAAIVRALWAKRRGVPGFVVFLADRQQFPHWLRPTGSSLPGAAIGVTTFPRMVEADGRNRFAQPDLKSLNKPVYEPQYLERGAGARIVLDMTAIHGTREVEQTLAHEMAHANGPNLIQTENLDFATANNGPSVVNQPTWAIEGFARYVEYLDNPSYADQAMRLVRQKRSTYRLPGPFPASKGFYDGDAERGTFNYDLSSSIFLAADHTGGRQKAVNLYIALTNNGEALSDTETFLNPLLKQVGLSPSKVWSAQHTLTGR